jgi:Na+-translocating ferredoxin:NAD+ oxidoreductase subunit D
MGLVLVALLPGAAMQAWLLGAGLIFNVLLAVAFALSFETLMLKLRERPLRPFLSDLSAPLAAILLTLLLPYSTPWWMVAFGVCAAIVFAKHLFGGLGENLFNPAMVGYAALVVVFPSFFNKAAFESQSMAELPFLACSLYALGGLLLVGKSIIPWQAPVATLVAAAIAELLLRMASPGLGALAVHELSSGVMLFAAFFIVTDPVTGCWSGRGRLCFGAGVGLLWVLMGHASDYATGLPFAVLTMNCLAPWLDRHTRPARQRVADPS